MEKPSSYEELMDLIENGDIEILASEDKDDGTTLVYILDHRMTYEEGKIYEIRI